MDGETLQLPNKPQKQHTIYMTHIDYSIVICPSFFPNECPHFPQVALSLSNFHPEIPPAGQHLKAPAAQSSFVPSTFQRSTCRSLRQVNTSRGIANIQTKIFHLCLSRNFQTLENHYLVTGFLVSRIATLNPPPKKNPCTGRILSINSYGGW